MRRNIVQRCIAIIMSIIMLGTLQFTNGTMVKADDGGATIIFQKNISNGVDGDIYYKLDDKWEKISQWVDSKYQLKLEAGQQTLAIRAVPSEGGEINRSQSEIDGSKINADISAELKSDKGYTLNIAGKESINITIEFDNNPGNTQGPGGDGQEPSQPGGGTQPPQVNYNFSWNVINGSASNVISAQYKVKEEAGWANSLSGDLKEGDKVTLRMTLAQGYAIENLSATYMVKDDNSNGGDSTRFPYITDDDPATKAQKILSDEGYTFTFKPEADSKNTSGETGLAADKAWLRIQFDLNQVFLDKIKLTFLYQEAVMDANWDFVKDSAGNYQYGIYENKYIDAIDGWEAENFKFNGQMGFCQFSDDRKENTVQKKYTYISSYGDNTGNSVEYTPRFITSKEMGGYTNGTANVIEFNDPNIEELYVDKDGNSKFTKDEIIEPLNNEKGKYRIELDAAEEYTFFAKRIRNLSVNIGWSYLEGAAPDMVVEHGKVYVQKIERKEETIVDGLKLSSDGQKYEYETMPVDDSYTKIDCTKVSGEVKTRLGDKVTLKLVPDYGYQLRSASINGQELSADESVSTFTVIVGGNLHFSGAFVKAEDKIDTSNAREIASAEIQNGKNAADTGNLQLTVADNDNYEKDVTGQISGTVTDTVATLDMSMNNIVSKGAENQYWSTPVTEFANNIAVSLHLNDIDLQEGEEIVVVREHDGQLDVLDGISFDDTSNILTIPTNKFSTYSIVKVSNSHVHAWDSGTVTKEATCIAVGTKTYSCTVDGCEKIKTETIDELGHDLTEQISARVEATCTTDGTTAVMKCSRCSHQEGGATINKLGHAWDSGTVTTPATCTTTGSKLFNCTRQECSATRTETIALRNHNLTNEVSAKVEATCTSDGREAVIGCTMCGYTEGGEVINKLGHAWDSGSVTKEATCIASGSKEFKCTRAGCTESKTEEIAINKNNHVKTELRGKKEATASEDGYTGDTCCVACNTVIEKGKVIPKKEEHKEPAKGETIKDDKNNNAEFVVKDTKKKEVTYNKPTNTNAKSVTIPASIKVNGVTYKITAVADNAFKGNKKVTKVTIGKNITSIGKNAFNGASKLTTISIGSNVTTIGANAFKGCSSLKSVTLASKTSKIGANAFDGCKKMTTLIIKSSKLTSKSISKNAFKGIPKKTIIKVPKKKYNSYKKLFKSKGLSSKVKIKGY